MTEKKILSFFFCKRKIVWWDSDLIEKKKFQFNLAVVVTIQQVCVCEKFFHIIKHKRVKRGLRFRRVVSTWELSVFFLFFLIYFICEKKSFCFVLKSFADQKFRLLLSWTLTKYFFWTIKKKSILFYEWKYSVDLVTLFIHITLRHKKKKGRKECWANQPYHHHQKIVWMKHLLLLLPYRQQWYKHWTDHWPFLTNLGHQYFLQKKNSLRQRKIIIEIWPCLIFFWYLVIMVSEKLNFFSFFSYFYLLFFLFLGRNRMSE